MKVIKPQQVGVLQRTYQDGGESLLSVTQLLFFSFEPVGGLGSEIALWPFVATELGKDAALDLGMPKPRGELLVTGRAYPEGGVAASHCAVQVSIGELDKTLHVIGDRTWSAAGTTAPKPFTEMAISYENAFGGTGYAQNPIGKGRIPVRTADGDVYPLPNIQEPQRPVRSPFDAHPPAGLGPYEFIWPQRYAKIGTYDKQWLRTRFPGFAADLDWTLFNAAPSDQQLGGYFRGDEEFVLRNMHPQKPLITARLPGIATRCFINQRQTDGNQAFSEVSTHLDTVWLFPHAERGILLFRGIVRVIEDDAADVLQLVTGCEWLREPKSVAHYANVLEQRMDRKSGVIHALREDELLPGQLPATCLPPEPGGVAEMTRQVTSQGLRRQNLNRRAECQLEMARKKLIACGVDPAKYVPTFSTVENPPSNPAEVPAYLERMIKLGQQTKEMLASKRASQEQTARQLCTRQGMEYEKLLASRQAQDAAKLRISADARLAQLRAVAAKARSAGTPSARLEALLVDPTLEEQLRRAESAMRQMYRRSAHHIAAAEPSSEARALRAQVQQAYLHGQSLANRDLTQADLSQLDLHGVDLRGALLEGVNLAGTNLAGADLTMAVLARADLSQATFTGAKLVSCNLGLARLLGARCDGVDLTGAVLAGADLSDSSFCGAILLKADLSEARLHQTDLRNVQGAGLTFLKSDLSSFRCAGADFSKANFIEVTIAGADFSCATLNAAVFVSAQGAGALFRGAQLGSLRIVKDSALPGADFTDAFMRSANLRGTALMGSDFTRAQLDGADLSECNLRGATFYQSVAKDARFVRADLSNAQLISVNLARALLQKATLHGTSFLGANLFQADLALAKMDQHTCLRDAMLTHARMLPRSADASG